MQNILVVEDEKHMATGLKFNLEQEGYKVKVIDNGKDAIIEFDRNEYDLMVLDIMLPEIDGYTVAKIIKEKEPKFPILILTAKSLKEDIIKGLDIGVDDYLIKPVHLEEFILRVKGILKRSSWYREDKKEKNFILNFGNNFLDINNLELKMEGCYPRRLTETEAMILKILIENAGKIVTRDKILESVWDTSYMETRTIDNFIVRLRKYIEKDPSNPKYIVSIRGRGYSFKL